MKCVFSVKTSPTIVVSVAIKVRGRSRTLSDILRVFILRRIPFRVTYVESHVKPGEVIRDMSERIIKIKLFPCDPFSLNFSFHGTRTCRVIHILHDFTIRRILQTRRWEILLRRLPKGIQAETGH